MTDRERRLNAAFPGWPVEAGFQLLTPSEIEPPWMTFMKQQQAQSVAEPEDAEDGAGV